MAKKLLYAASGGEAFATIDDMTTALSMVTDKSPSATSSPDYDPPHMELNKTITAMGLVNESWFIGAHYHGLLWTPPIPCSDIEVAADGFKYVETSIVVYHTQTDQNLVDSYPLSFRVGSTSGNYSTSSGSGVIHARLIDGGLTVSGDGSITIHSITSTNTIDILPNEVYYLTLRVSSCSSANTDDGIYALYVNGVKYIEGTWRSGVTAIATFADTYETQLRSWPQYVYCRDMLLWSGWTTDGVRIPPSPYIVTDMVPNSVTTNAGGTPIGGTEAEVISDNDDATYVELDGPTAHLVVRQNSGVDPAVAGKDVAAIISYVKIARGGISPTDVELEHYEVQVGLGDPYIYIGESVSPVFDNIRFATMPSTSVSPNDLTLLISNIDPDE